MARHGSADCGMDFHYSKQTRDACADYKNTFNDGGSEDMLQRRKKRKIYDSADSAECVGIMEEECARSANERKKQRRQATTRGSSYYDDDEYGNANEKIAHDKYRRRIHRKSVTSKRHCYADDDDGSSVSDTETLTVTDTSDASSSVSKNSRRHRNSTKYRSYDDIVYNSDGVNYTKCKRNISTERRLTPTRFTVMQNYAPAANAEGLLRTTNNNNNNDKSKKSANEMLQFVNSLFRSLGGTSSAIVLNTTGGGGRGCDGGGSQRDVNSRGGGMTQMIDDECNNHGVALPQHNTQYRAPDRCVAMENSRALLVNASTSNNPQGNPQEMATTEEARPRNYFVTHNETANLFPQAPSQSQRYNMEESISKTLPLQAQPTDCGTSNQTHNYALSQYVPQSQAKFASTPQLNFEPTPMTYEKNANSYPPLTVTQAYLAAQKTTPTIKFALSHYPTPSTNHNTYAPQTQSTNYKTHAPQAESTNHNFYAPQAEFTNHKTYAPQTQSTNNHTYAPHRQSRNHNYYATQADFTDRNAYAPQTQSTNHNTYAPQAEYTARNAFAPQPQTTNNNAYAPQNFTQSKAPQYFPPNNAQTQENMFSPPSGSPNMPTNRADLPQQAAATRAPLPPLKPPMEYVNEYRNVPQRYMLTDVPLVPQLDSHITHENLVDVTYITPRPTNMGIITENEGVDEFEATQDTLTDPPIAAVDGRQVEGQPNAALMEAATNETDYYEPLKNANANVDTHTLPGNISRQQMNAQADQRINFPIIANRVQEKLNYTTNGKDAGVRTNENNVRAATNETEQTGSKQNNTNPESEKTPEANAEKQTKTKKDKHRKNSNNDDEEETSSTCSSDYIRECLRKKKRKRKQKNDGAEKRHSHTKNRKHDRRDSYESDESDNDSEQSSINYSQRSRYSGSRSRSKRHSGKNYEPYTPSGTESDDEMDYRYSKTSCKQSRKCCSRSRIVAICRMARDSAGTQTDECCGCGCCCDCSARTKRSASQAECGCNSKLERDIQRSICEGLANADQNTLRKIIELNSDKAKQCKVCTCGIVGENGAPVLKSDMIIIKFEENEKNNKCEALEQEKCTCAQERNCKVTESESELIQALIRKKRVYQKIQKACSITKIGSDSCDCMCAAPDDGAQVEHEFMEDLLRRQRLERSMQQCAAKNCDDCKCEIENKAKELAANVMKELISNHIRSMCAAELANKAKSVECACNEAESESSESCAECLCGQESEPKKRDVGVGDISVMQPCDCTCGAKESIKPERSRVSLTRSVRTFGKQKDNPSAESVRFSIEKESGCERGCTCCSAEKNAYSPTKKKSAIKTAKRTSSNSSGVSGNMNIRDGCCSCKPSKNELRKDKEQKKPQKIIEIKISASSQGSVRDDRRDVRAGNCTCKTPMQSSSTQLKQARETQLKQARGPQLTSARSAQPKSVRDTQPKSRSNARRSLENDYTDDSEVSRASVRSGNCTCKPPKQSPIATQKAKQAQSMRSLNKKVSDNAAMRNVTKNAHEDKTSRVSLTKANVNKPSTCRPDCTCKGAISPRTSESDYEAQPRRAARNSKTCRPDCACKDKIRENIKPEATRGSKPIRAMSKDIVKACRPDCACKQRAGDNNSDSTSDDSDGDDDDSTTDDSGHKSIQKLIIDIKASKQARASCTLITYPKSSKNAEVYKSLVEQSTSAGARNGQRAALCAELTMNNLLPEQSLRTLLTKLSSPQGKLFYEKNLDTKLPEEDINTFSLDESKVLSLKKGRNGKMKPTMIMSQAIRVTGNKSTTAAAATTGMADAELARLQYFKNKLLKISCSAPSVVTSQVLTADGGSKNDIQERAEHAEREKMKTLHSEERSSKKKIKKSLIPLPLERSLGGRHSNDSKLFTLPQSASAEARANKRPLIDQTSDLNHHITKLWPERASTTAQRQKDEKKQTQQKNKEKSPTTVALTKSQSNIEFALAKNAGFYSSGARPRLASGTQREFKKSSSSSSNDAHFVQSQIKSKKKHHNKLSSEQKSPPKMVNILDAANRSHVYARDSCESNQSYPTSLADSKYKSAQQQKINRKKAEGAKERAFESTQTYSNNSIDYIARQDSPIITRKNDTKNKKQRVTRFSISDDEPSASEVECCSLDLKDSQSDRYQVYLQRKQQLWRRGTVKKALEVEEEESERTNRHWQRTTLTGECLERAIHYPTSVWNEERRQLNLKRNAGSLFGIF